MISISIYGLESFLLCICRCASSITFLVQQTTSRIGGRSTVAIYGAHDVLKVRNNNNTSVGLGLRECDEGDGFEICARFWPEAFYRLR